MPHDEYDTGLVGPEYLEKTSQQRLTLLSALDVSLRLFPPSRVFKYFLPKHKRASCIQIADEKRITQIQILHRQGRAQFKIGFKMVTLFGIRIFQFKASREVQKRTKNKCIREHAEIKILSYILLLCCTKSCESIKFVLTEKPRERDCFSYFKFFHLRYG